MDDSGQTQGVASPVPETTPVPEDILLRWSALPPDAQLRENITRADFDGLLLSIRRLQDACGFLVFAFDAAEKRDHPKAVDLSNKAREQLAYSMNRLTNFMISVMPKVGPADGE